MIIKASSECINHYSAHYNQFPATLTVIDFKYCLLLRNLFAIILFVFLMHTL